MNKTLLLFALAGIPLAPTCMTITAADNFVIDGFGKQSAAVWKITCAPKFTPNPDFGATVKLGNDNQPVLKLEFTKKDSKGKIKNKWFKISRSITPQPEWKNATGIKVDLAVKKTGQWWLQLSVTSGGEQFNKTLIPYNYTGMSLQDRTAPFKSFKSKSGKKLDPTQITAINITGSLPENTLYLAKLSLMMKSQLKHFVKFTTNVPDLNIFEPGQQVEMTFSVLGNLPPKAKSLRYEVRDYFDKLVNTGNIPVKHGQKQYTAKFTPAQSGYYDVKAYWLDGNSKQLDKMSCIKTFGSLEQGRGTFAVMPNTIKQNIARMKKYGEAAFFGFHGNSSNLVDRMGMSWRLRGRRWKWDEPKVKPKMIDGTAEWAAKIIANDKPDPDWQNNFCNQAMNIASNLPGWAKRSNLNPAPGLKDVNEYYRYLRDVVKVNKHQYPGMKQRVYDIFWEVNLNRPKVGIHKPTYYPEDIIKQYQTAGKVIKSEDSNAILSGPCCSSPFKNFDWNIPLFEQGLCKYIDAYNCHGYHTPPPEDDNVVPNLRRLQKMIKQYNNGKPLDIYCTELGYRSQFGSHDKHKEHAQWHARIATILKGEGVRVYYPFYSYDYRGADNSWGVCYNLNPKLGWGPKHVSPKAAVPALAVCANELEGTEPVSDQPWFGRDIWCYIFKEIESGKPVVVIWSVHNKHKLKFPAGNVKSLQVTNIMGHRSNIKVNNGFATLDISPSLLYIRGADAAIYAAPGKIADRLIGKLYPGEKVKLKACSKTIKKLEYYGDIKLNAASATGELEISVPANSRPGAIPVLINGNIVKWLAILEPLKVEKTALQKQNGQLAIALTLKNMGIVPLPTKVTFDPVGSRELTVEKIIGKQSTAEFLMPLRISGKIDPGKPLACRISIKSGSLAETVLDKQFSLLSAHLRGENGKDKLPNTISWQGKSASGGIDKATAAFEWDKKNLYIQVKVKDKIFHQTRTDGTIWKMDSLQVAFDTHPELNDLYAPLAGIFTKKVTSLDFAMTPKGRLVWRDRTHNAEELKLNKVTDKVGFDFKRDSKNGILTYKLSIPWKEIGLDKVEKGKPIGIAILVNDSDGEKTRRTGLELFKGIMRGKNHRLYGVINLN